MVGTVRAHGRAEVCLQVGSHHAATVAEAQRGAEHWQAQARKSVALAEETVRRTVEVLEQQARGAEEAQRRAVAAREVEVGVDAQRAANAERIARHAALDEVCAAHLVTCKSIAYLVTCGSVALEWCARVVTRAWQPHRGPLYVRLRLVRCRWRAPGAVHAQVAAQEGAQVVSTAY